MNRKDLVNALGFETDDEGRVYAQETVIRPPRLLINPATGEIILSLCAAQIHHLFLLSETQLKDLSESLALLQKSLGQSALLRKSPYDTQ